MAFCHRILAAWTHVFKKSSVTAPGVVCERLAAGYLKRAGYRVIGCNLSNRFGEVDILAEAPDRRTIIVVEVKGSVIAADHRLSVRPEQRVGHRKQRRLVALAGQVARRYGLTQRPIRFDVVGVELSRDAGPVIRHHIGAFESHV